MIKSLAIGGQSTFQPLFSAEIRVGLKAPPFCSHLIPPATNLRVLRGFLKSPLINTNPVVVERGLLRIMRHPFHSSCSAAFQEGRTRDQTLKKMLFLSKFHEFWKP